MIFRTIWSKQNNGSNGCQASQTPQLGMWLHYSDYPSYPVRSDLSSLIGSALSKLSKPWCDILWWRRATDRWKSHILCVSRRDVGEQMGNFDMVRGNDLDPLKSLIFSMFFLESNTCKDLGKVLQGVSSLFLIEPKLIDQVEFWSHKGKHWSYDDYLWKGWKICPMLFWSTLMASYCSLMQGLLELKRMCSSRM